MLDYSRKNILGKIRLKKIGLVAHDSKRGGGELLYCIRGKTQKTSCLNWKHRTSDRGGCQPPKRLCRRTSGRFPQQLGAQIETNRN